MCVCVCMYIYIYIYIYILMIFFIFYLFYCYKTQSSKKLKSMFVRSEINKTIFFYYYLFYYTHIIYLILYNKENSYQRKGENFIFNVHFYDVKLNIIKYKMFLYICIYNI